MSIDTPTLLDALDSVTAIPIVPFKDGEIDYAGHAKNINYLMQNNYLEGDRKRVIAIAGTSLIHHVSLEDQTRIMDATGREMAGDGVSDVRYCAEPNRGRRETHRSTVQFAASTRCISDNAFNRNLKSRRRI